LDAWAIERVIYSTGENQALADGRLEKPAREHATA
jgi:hypothetical protein